MKTVVALVLAFATVTSVYADCQIVIVNQTTSCTVCTTGAGTGVTTVICPP